MKTAPFLCTILTNKPKSKNGIKVTVPNYVEVDERSAEITISSERYGISKTVKVTQGAFTPVLTILPEVLNFAVEGGTQEVAITANFEYEVDSDASWLSFERYDKGVKVTAIVNNIFEERTTEITISNEKYGISKVVKVAQGAFVPEITFSLKSLTFDYKGGTQEVAIIANFEYEVSANADWLTIKKSDKGLNISATPNTKFKECTAKITISNNKYSISKTISVVQKGVSAEPQNVIIYTSSDGKIVTPYKSDVFGANIVSNTYRDGQGIIIFDAPVTSIGERAFDWRTSLTSVTIPDSVTEIGGWAFSDCSLTSVTIPNSVTSIGNYAFDGCTSLTSVTIPDSVTSIGFHAFFYCKSLASVTIPDSVTSIGAEAFSKCTSLTSVTIGNSVTSIGDSAFSFCTSLTSITIPNSVTSIGYDAFEGCTGELIIDSNALGLYGGKFTKLTIGNSVTSIVDSAFSFCTSLTSVTIGNSVTSIGGSAFEGCTSLASVTIPNSVTSIGNYAFQYCSSLTSVTIPNSVTSIESDAFYDCTSLTSVHIFDLSAWCKIDFGNSYANPLRNGIDLHLNGNKVTDITISSDIAEIKNYTFCKCTSLTSVTIPDSVTSIGYDAFDGCTSLTSVTIGNSVTSIGSYAFDGCTSLKSITIPDSVTEIGNSAFSGCKSLTSVTIGNSVTSIGEYAFSGCTSLTSVTIPDSVTSIGGWAFGGCTGELIINSKIVETNYNNSPANSNNGWLYRSKFTKLTIGNSVTSIGERAFEYCSSLTSVTIGNSVTSIGNYAFQYCSSLTSVTIPNSVTSIGERAFRGCTSLKSVTIPDSVTSIGNYAFYYCTSLTRVYCKPIIPPTGGSYMFGNNASGRKIYVPTTSVAAYKTALYWSDYASDIVGYDF